MFDVEIIKNEQTFSNERNGRVLYQNMFIVQQYGIKHMRTVFDFLALIGDLGGVFELVFGLISLIIYPFSEHVFYLRTLKRLFQVNSSHFQFMNEFAAFKQKSGT